MTGNSERLNCYQVLSLFFLLKISSACCSFWKGHKFFLFWVRRQRRRKNGLFGEKTCSSFFLKWHLLPLFLVKYWWDVKKVGLLVNFLF